MKRCGCHRDAQDTVAKSANRNWRVKDILERVDMGFGKEKVTVRTKTKGKRLEYGIKLDFSVN